MATPLGLALLALLQASHPPDAGPAVGDRLPAFELADQDGVRRTFDSLRGPKGLVLLFYRSADW